MEKNLSFLELESGLREYIALDLIARDLESKARKAQGDVLDKGDDLVREHYDILPEQSLVECDGEIYLVAISVDDATMISVEVMQSISREAELERPNAALRSAWRRLDGFV